jgi:methyltransferase
LIAEAANSDDRSFQISGGAVPPNQPRAKHGLYWGYKVRLARSLHEIFTKCPYGRDGGYDFMIGQSEKGVSIDDVDPHRLKKGRKLGEDAAGNDDDDDEDEEEHEEEGDNENMKGKKMKKMKKNKPKKHVLMVFGGGGGRTIESCVDADETMPIHGKDADTLFDLWVNPCPQYGSKQVRTEEAVLLGLTALRPVIKAVTR